MANRKQQIATLKKWAKALRSGEYEQVQISLRDDGNRMCCLGVLCDVVAPERWNGNAYIIEPAHPQDVVTGFPPNDILKAAGIRHEDGQELYTLNDSLGATFAEIADVVDWMRYDLEGRDK